MPGEKAISLESDLERALGACVLKGLRRAIQRCKTSAEGSDGYADYDQVEAAIAKRLSIGDGRFGHFLRAQGEAVWNLEGHELMTDLRLSRRMEQFDGVEVAPTQDAGQPEDALEKVPA